MASPPAARGPWPCGGEDGAVGVIGSRDELERNLAIVRRGILAASERSGRDPSEIRLVAAAKAVPPDVVRWAVEAGVTDVGENYVNELAAKRDQVHGATWHFVGVLQSHTAHRVAEHADVVHTVASPRALARLDGRAERNGRRLPVLIEVDFAGRGTGAPPEDVPELAERARSLVGVDLRGMMTIPPLTANPEDARPYFRQLRELRDAVAGGMGAARDLPELSMGMSADYEVAVEEGATMVRIGTALFGERPSPGAD
jgi:PLP dependent protein